VVLELRGAETKSAITKAGHYQTTEFMGREGAREGMRAAFPQVGRSLVFDDAPTAKMFPTEMGANSCHFATHGRWNTTFVAFLPTLN